MVKVSVIVPVYNVYNYLDKCLNSLVNQTLKEIEIIIVNDGSPDKSEEIIDLYTHKYPKKIKAFKTKNGGQGSARNYGLKYATGEYIGYVDSDDYVALDMYEKLYHQAKKEKADIAICSDVIVYEDKETMKVNQIIRVIEDDKINAFFGNMGVCNKIYKKSLLADLSFRSKVWYEDLDFTVKVLSRAKKITYLNEGLYYYLLRTGSTMNNSNIKRNLEIIEAFDNLIHDPSIDHEIIEFLAIDHIYISAIVRVIRARGDKATTKDIIKELTNYVTTNFKDFKKNKYLKYLSRNRYIVYKLLNYKLYSIIKLIFRRD